MDGSPKSSEKKRKAKPVPTPEALRRGRALQSWLDEQEFEAAAFAREAGISKMSVGMYLRGELDIANMHQRTVEKLLAAMHVSDAWAWDYFEIPETRRSHWRTFREAPMGAGTSDEEGQQQRVVLVLDGPMFGEGYAAPEGTLVTYDPTVKIHGLLVTKLPGRYVLAMADALPNSGVVLGQFLAAAPASAEAMN